MPCALDIHGTTTCDVERMMEDNKSKQHIILVHGACHGAWCWYKVATRLRLAGHRVTVPDLVASGIDLRRVEEISNFTDYSRPLLEVMASLPPEERVVLVGHSLGGFNVAVAMERFPEKVALAVFIAGFMPDSTNSIWYLREQLHKHTAPTHTQMDNIASFEGEESEAKVLTSLKFGPQFMASRLYQLCPPEDLTLATMLVRPTATALAEYRSDTPSFSMDRYGSVACVYIVCREDKTFPMEFQRWLTQDHPVKEVVEIEGADHMAMLSKPKELCESLLRVVDDIA